MSANRVRISFAVALILSSLPACRTARDGDEAPDAPSIPGRAGTAGAIGTAGTTAATTGAPVTVPPQDRPELAWWRESMKTRDLRVAWWREARFGMFVHWGVYSHLGGIWQGQPVSGYAEHIQRKQKIPVAVYREQVAAQFNPTGFDADAWISAAKRAGMGYFVITAKHHDGFAMWDTATTDYDVVDATPWKTDPMRALKDACQRHGVRFGFYYSHAFDWGDAEGPGNDWEYKNPGGDLLLHGAEWWVSAPELLPQVRRYVDRKAIPQLRELIQKYDPDILWFDTAHKLPLEENLRILKAVREAKPEIVVNGRITQGAPGGPEARFGDYMNTADRPAELYSPQGDWEAIPTTNESYGHHRMDTSHKPASHFVQLLAKAAARGGNLLLNIGPMGDGRIDPKDAAILDGIAGWMKTNEPSVRGTSRTPLPVQEWGHSTRKGSRLYLHVFDWPSDGKLYVAGLKTDVLAGRLLGDPAAPVRARRANAYDVELQVPAQAPDPWDSVIVLDCIDAVEGHPARLITSTGTTSLHVFDGVLSGKPLRYADGKRDRDIVLGWTAAGSGVSWPVRLTQAGRFALWLDYTSGKADDTGQFEIKLGTTVLPVSVPASAAGFATKAIGEIDVPAGESVLSVTRTDKGSGELLRLRRIELRPVQDRP
jgi:alpha-L-fucosidase